MSQPAGSRMDHHAHTADLETERLRDLGRRRSRRPLGSPRSGSPRPGFPPDGALSSRRPRSPLPRRRRTPRRGPRSAPRRGPRRDLAPPRIGSRPRGSGRAPVRHGAPRYRRRPRLEGWRDPARPSTRASREQGRPPSLGRRAAARRRRCRTPRRRATPHLHVRSRSPRRRRWGSRSPNGRRASRTRRPRCRGGWPRSPPAPAPVRRRPQVSATERRTRHPGPASLRAVRSATGPAFPR